MKLSNKEIKEIVDRDGLSDAISAVSTDQISDERLAHYWEMAEVSTMMIESILAGEEK